MARIAVVLFNLGGPDSLEAVRPFLFNLFRDPAILRVPSFLRLALAWIISTQRAKVARGIYARLGGRSPLLELTQAQSAALQSALGEDREHVIGTFVAMRYWHPMSRETAKAVADFRPDRVVLLPLYPQFSSTTSGSSVAAWKEAAAAAGLRVAPQIICCYPTDGGFTGAVAALTRTALDTVPAGLERRLLFSAHGLPKRVIAAGDPYQWHVERSTRAVVSRLGNLASDHVICYQSRVGPLEWIGPSTEAELERAARDKVAVVVIPIAFVSEHSETLVELDMEYRDTAHRLGVPAYVRVPTVGTHPVFIAGLARLVREALARGAGVGSSEAEPCPEIWRDCPCRIAASPAA